MKIAIPAEVDFLEEGSTAQDAVEQKIKESSATEDRAAFYICDLGDVVRKLQRWMRVLPRVAPYYAFKCNDTPAVVATLASLGIGFDCASKGEIQQILSLGVDPSRIIYANPSKQMSHIKYACAQRVHTMTFDSEEELEKVAHEGGRNIRWVLRIHVDNPKAKIILSSKFGAPLEACGGLLERAKALGQNVVGVSFHVGSDCCDTQAFDKAIADAHHVFRMGEELGFKMDLLDIGGGFPGSEDVPIKFEEFSPTITRVLDKYFPADSGVKVIAEPGRYFVDSAFTLVANIITKQTKRQGNSASCGENKATQERSLSYHVNDGVYTSFKFVPLHNYQYLPTPHKKAGPGEALFPCTIWGQTCDSVDCIAERCYLPELQVGDWLIFKNMGAYTVSTACAFNGFPKPDVHFVMSRAAWQHLQASSPALDQFQVSSCCEQLQNTQKMH